MERELLRDYLEKSGMDALQADALSRIFADMEARLATKADLAQLRLEMAEMKADLTWRMIAIVGFFATAATLLNLFVS
jgi:hypothetical protein